MARQVLILVKETEAEEIGSVEELFLAQAQLRTIDSGYQDLSLDTPEWIIDKLGEIDREINLRVKSDLAHRLKIAKARRASLRTADEKRKDLDAEIAALESKLM